MTAPSSTSTGAPAIEVEGLLKQFKKGPRAVDGIDLQVAPGEIYGFLGRNGAGKSTTVLMLTTLLPPSGGVARVGGYDIATEGPAVRREIGAALQEAALDQHLTAREHMRLQTGLHGIAKSERRKLGDDLIERVDHGKIVAEGTPKALKAEVGEPSIEAIPSDQRDRGHLGEILNEFAGPGECSESRADAVAVRLAPDNRGLADVIRRLDQEGIELAHLQLHAPSLDDVFLEATGRSLEGSSGAEAAIEEPDLGAPRSVAS